MKRSTSTALLVSVLCTGCMMNPLPPDYVSTVPPTPSAGTIIEQAAAALAAELISKLPEPDYEVMMGEIRGCDAAATQLAAGLVLPIRSRLTASKKPRITFVAVRELAQRSARIPLDLWGTIVDQGSAWGCEMFLVNATTGDSVADAYRQIPKLKGRTPGYGVSAGTATPGTPGTSLALDDGWPMLFLTGVTHTTTATVVSLRFENTTPGEEFDVQAVDPSTYTFLVNDRGYRQSLTGWTLASSVFKLRYGERCEVSLFFENQVGDGGRATFYSRWYAAGRPNCAWNQHRAFKIENLSVTAGP